MAPLGLPVFVVKYAGSALWAVMVYWLLGANSPRTKRLMLAGASAGIAVLVELFKLIQTPRLDAFRETLAGKLLIGKHFALADILAYCIAIAIVARIDDRTAQKS